MLRVFVGCGRLSVALSVSPGTKMTHRRRGRVLGKDTERGGSKWDARHCRSGGVQRDPLGSDMLASRF